MLRVCRKLTNTHSWSILHNDIKSNEYSKTNSRSIQTNCSKMVFLNAVNLQGPVFIFFLNQSVYYVKQVLTQYSVLQKTFLLVCFPTIAGAVQRMECIVLFYIFRNLVYLYHLARLIQLHQASAVIHFFLGQPTPSNFL